MIFEWDQAKAAANFVKHGVRFEVARRVFDDPAIYWLDASEPYDAEPRETAIGMVDGRLYAVVHVIRGDICRIISARHAERKEARRYANR